MSNKNHFINFLNEYLVGIMFIFYIMALFSLYKKCMISLYITIIITIIIALILCFRLLYASFKKLVPINKQKIEISLSKIIIHYLIFIIASILLFTLIYQTLDATKLGYLTYDNCGNLNSNDSLRVIGTRDNIYFSAVTFFSVGYGDICPRGYSKEVSIFNMILGNFFSVIIIALAISFFFNPEKSLKK